MYLKGKNLNMFWILSGNNHKGMILPEVIRRIPSFIVPRFPNCKTQKHNMPINALISHKIVKLKSALQTKNTKAIALWGTGGCTNNVVMTNNGINLLTTELMATPTSSAK